MFNKKADLAVFMSTFILFILILFNFISLSFDDILDIAYFVNSDGFTDLDVKLSDKEYIKLKEICKIDDLDSDLISLDTVLNNYNYFIDSNIESEDVDNLIENEGVYYIERSKLTNLPYTVFDQRNGYGYTLLTKKNSINCNLITEFDNSEKHKYIFCFRDETEYKNRWVYIETNIFNRLKNIEVKVKS